MPVHENLVGGMLTVSVPPSSNGTCSPCTHGSADMASVFTLASGDAVVEFHPDVVVTVSPLSVTVMSTAVLEDALTPAAVPEAAPAPAPAAAPRPPSRADVLAARLAEKLAVTPTVAPEIGSPASPATPAAASTSGEQLFSASLHAPAAHPSHHEQPGSPPMHDGGSGHRRNWRRGTGIGVGAVAALIFVAAVVMLCWPYPDQPVQLDSKDVMFSSAVNPSYTRSLAL